jgi:hypothetical protein
VIAFADSGSPGALIAPNPSPRHSLPHWLIAFES